jgi:hypothetical protein
MRYFGCMSAIVIMLFFARLMTISYFYQLFQRLQIKHVHWHWTRGSLIIFQFKINRALFFQIAL